MPRTALFGTCHCRLSKMDEAATAQECCTQKPDTVFGKTTLCTHVTHW